LPRAGYSPGSAKQQGSRLLTNADIRALVDARVERLTERTELSVERVILELHRVLTADPVHALNDDGTAKPLKDWPEDLRRALSGFEVEELWEGRGEDRVQAAEAEDVERVVDRLESTGGATLSRACRREQVFERFVVPQRRKCLLCVSITDVGYLIQ